MNLLFVLLFAATATGLLAVFIVADYAVHLVRLWWIARGIQQELAAMPCLHLGTVQAWHYVAVNGTVEAKVVNECVRCGCAVPECRVSSGQSTGHLAPEVEQGRAVHPTPTLEARTRRRLTLAVGNSSERIH